MAFDVPAYRIHAYVRSLNRRRALRRQQAKSEFHLKRAFAELSFFTGLGAPRDVIGATVVLNDVMPRGLSVFAERPVEIGEHLSLTIHGHRGFFARGRVVSCYPLSSRTSAASGKSYNYRVAIAFEFGSLDERLAIKSYCDDLATRYLKSPEL